MRLGNTNNKITKSSNGEWWYLFSDENQEDWVKADANIVPLLEEIYKAYRTRTMTDEEKENLFRVNWSSIKQVESGNATEVTSASTLQKIAKELIDFFSEFHFEPNFRFVNTLAWECKSSIQDGKDYITRYFELCDSPFTDSITEKMKSTEFNYLIDNIRKIFLSQRINKRFRLYYGSQGTGKTTRALEESEGNCMVCHSAMLPQDLMEDFKFEDGKATFQKSALYNAILNGKKIVLDEINLLPFESLRFLQSILDGKKSFTYKGEEVSIADGFQIIGTMNLVVNGAVYSLPEPLIDRADKLSKFTLTANDLIGALA